MFKKKSIAILMLLLTLISMSNIKLFSQTAQNFSLDGGFVDGKKIFTIRMNEKIQDLPSLSGFEVYTNDNLKVEIVSISKNPDPYECSILAMNEINIKKEYYITFLGIKKRLVMNKIYKDPKYYDLKTELGSIYQKSFTTFRLFAPRATQVKVIVYDNPIRTPNEKFGEYEMVEKKSGVWETIVKKDLAGKYYTYKIESVGNDCNPGLEIVDPYAKIITRGDGVSVLRKSEKQLFDQTLGRGIIVDLKNTEKVAVLNSKLNKVEDAIIWEVHTRDLTRSEDSGVPDDKKGLFSGARYQGAKYKNYSTGFDHIVDLGVTVVQLLPVSEFVVGNESEYKQKYIHYSDQGNWPDKRYYDWGYGPINYFSPEGWYSSKIDDPTRINELKNLISEFHKKGIRVTLDVVFNHTFEGSRKAPNTFIFRGIDADYYYRSMPDETFYDGIYCQNELNTENPMVGKYIIDCLKYWVNEFKVDGFRFDWMSALDPETLAKMTSELKLINPNVLLYGELWTLRGLSYKGKNSGTYVDRQHIGMFEKDYKLAPGSIAGFNDYFRDAVKGSGFMRDYSGGYIQNTINEKYYPSTSSGHLPYELVRKTLMGMIGYIPKDDDKTEWQETKSPLNSINYIDCHDGYTLYDKLIIAEYCDYTEPGKPGAKRSTYPQSETNRNVVDFLDEKQSVDPNIENRLKRMNNFGAAILLTSQGIPFIHAGQEILRQKINYIKQQNSEKGLYIFDANSNTSSDDVNAIKWSNKEKYYDVFQYYQGLIKLRKEHPTFRRTSKESIINGLIFHDEWLPKESERCIAYNLTDPDNELKNEKWKEVIVLMNPYPETKEFQIPSGEWGIVVNHQKAGVEILERIKGNKVKVEGISLMVLYRK